MNATTTPCAASRQPQDAPQDAPDAPPAALAAEPHDPTDQPLRGQLALVTGASRGIGAAAALHLAACGADVVLTYCRHPGPAEEAAARIRALGRRAWARPLDLGRPDDIERFAAEFSDAHDPPHILVNNAGATDDALLATMRLDQLCGVMQTNALGPIWLTRLLVAGMIGRRYGRIVNITSAAATHPGRGQSNYAAAKGAMESFTRAMAVELAPKDILVNGVAPGLIATDMSLALREQAHAQIMQRMLLKRYGTPDEVAHWVGLLAGPANRYLTGQIIHLDGGLKQA